jgi:hypothetical protein
MYTNRRNISQQQQDRIVHVVNVELHSVTPTDRVQCAEIGFRIGEKLDALSIADTRWQVRVRLQHWADDSDRVDDTLAASAAGRLDLNMRNLKILIWRR